MIHNSGQYHVGKVALVWTKWGNGTEQNLLLHLNYVERNNNTKVFPAFIENHKCGKLNSTGTTSTSSFISEETDLCHRTILIHFNPTVKKNQFSGCWLLWVCFFIFPFLEMLLCLSNKLQRLWMKMSYYLAAVLEIFFFILLIEVFLFYVVIFASKSILCCTAFSLTERISCHSFLFNF